MINQELKDKAFIDLAGKDTEFEDCQFENVDFAGADLSGMVFMECRFRDCDLSNVILKRTAFREVRFEGCKMMGWVWGDCQPFFSIPELERCQLRLSSFVQVKLPGIHFRGCDLTEADFTGADLSGAKFEDTILTKAIFDQTDLRKADLRGALGFTIDPNRNKLQKMRISLEGAPGLLGFLGVITD